MQELKYECYSLPAIFVTLGNIKKGIGKSNEIMVYIEIAHDSISAERYADLKYAERQVIKITTNPALNLIIPTIGPTN